MHITFFLLLAISEFMSYSHVIFFTEIIQCYVVIEGCSVILVLLTQLYTEGNQDLMYLIER